MDIKTCDIQRIFDESKAKNPHEFAAWDIIINDNPTCARRITKTGTWLNVFLHTRAQLWSLYSFRIERSNTVITSEDVDKELKHLFSIRPDAYEDLKKDRSWFAKYGLLIF